MPSSTPHVISVVKRDGKRATESFDRSKLHNSIYTTCLSVRSHEGEADTTANRVCDAVVNWLSKKSEVTSNDLRRKATETLEQFHPEAAYLYKHYRSVI